MAKLKRKAKKRIRRLFLLLIIGLLCYAGYVGYNYLTDDNNIDIPIIIPPKEDPIKTYKASLIATGDALLHSTVYKAAYLSNADTYDFSSMLTYTKDLISNYDLKYYNQETVSDDSKPYGSYPRFNSPIKWNEQMIDIGFNLVSLATNHSMDMGGTSAKASAAWWETQENVLATGMFSSEEKRNEIVIKEINGITYTMLSYTYGTNGLGKAELANEPWIVNVFDEEKAKADIEKVRDKVDILIVAMHWGNEYNQSASETQRNQAKFLADNGVDIVLGTHSHCVEPWEKIGDTIVFYSFGNFISNQMGAEQAIVRKVGVVGMFATLDITKVVDTENDTTTITIDNIGADLNYTYRYNDSSTPNRKNYLVIPFSKMESQYLSNYESVYNEFSAVLKKYDDSINIAPLPTLQNEETSSVTN